MNKIRQHTKNTERDDSRDYMRIRKIVILTIVSSALFLQSCGKEKTVTTSGIDIQTASENKSEISFEDTSDSSTDNSLVDDKNNGIESKSNESKNDRDNKSNESEKNNQDKKTENKENSVVSKYSSGMLKFVDVFGQEYEVEINPNVESHQYDLNTFVREGEKLSYHDETFTSRLGVDVSHHQGTIDWQKVKAAGYDFVIVRLGYRGYGVAGNISLDREFENNVEGAKNAGLEVGVYFFAQAVNEAEAIEEADFVINHLKNHNITLPVVYDPESILDDIARTDNVTGEQFTKNTVAFCNRVKEAGYEPMVYSNMLWEAYNLNLEELADYPIWYADYEALPQTPYKFEYWQYTNEGRVDGIAGNVDINIQLYKRGVEE